MTLRTIRKNYLLALSLGVYLVTLLMLLSELDRQYYQVEKESLIKYNFRALFPHDTRRLQEVSGKMLGQHEAEGIVDARLATEWREIAQSMLDGEGCVFQIQIVPKDVEALIVQQDDLKFRRLNGSANTLFFRNFQSEASHEIFGSPGGGWLGLLSFHYTTPGQYEPIVSLTNRYRLWALLIFAALTACYGAVVRHLILPTKRVVSRIDAAASASPKVMPRPSSLLEKAYNNLARDAILLRVGQAIRSLSAENPTFDQSAVLARVPDLLIELLDYRAVLVFDLSLDKAGHVLVSGCAEANDGSASQDHRDHSLDHVLTPDTLKELGDAGRVVSGEYVVCEISGPDERPHRTCLALLLPDACPPKLEERRRDARAWHLETIDLLAEQLREILTALDLHRRHMRMERSKANINLARQLGHDLTNIIATSKLDIRTVKKVLAMTSSGDAEVDGPPLLLREAMGGLLNSTRLLQEVVNIYRSFSYIGRPRFETVAINSVLDEIIDVFALSLPGSTVVRRDYQEDLPECTVEPRLLKLVLFNLLTNAVSAIKQNADPERREGQITVSTRMDPESDRTCISVRDNGTGILNGEGETATQAEIDRIFRYGVSTKKEDGGEGLGLSWVWTIVEEFHNGRVEACNHADGGAEFLVFIGTDFRHEHMET